MKPFLFLCRAWRWKSAVLASPSLSQEIRERVLTTVLFSDDKAKVCFSSLFMSQTSLSNTTRLSCAISIWWSTSLAKASRLFTWPTFLCLQLSRALLVARNFLAKVSKGHALDWTDCQAISTASRNLSNCGQKDSKWNILLGACYATSYIYSSVEALLVLFSFLFVMY